ncbi:MAG: hypothetical protein M3Q24_02125 [bacterium]|nr:hypothetical protein [bacterium]
MNNDLLFDGKTYISVGRASKKLGYTADYLGQLCRAGKIDARMIGRTWYVEWESIKNHKKSKTHRVRRTAEKIRQERQTQASEKSNGNAIMVDEANEDCPEDDYLEKMDREAEATFKPEEQLTEPILVSLHEQESAPEADPGTYPSNLNGIKYLQDENILPSVLANKNQWLPELNKNSTKTEAKTFFKRRFELDPILIGGSSLVAFFIFMNLMFVSNNPVTNLSLENGVINAVSKIENISRVDTNASSVESLNKELVSSPDKSNLSAAYANIATVFNYFTDELRRKINRWAVGYLRSLGFVPQVKQQPDSTKKQGLVIVSDPDDHDATVASIKNSFSDEVTVVEDAEGGSGVITPIFKNIEGDPYTYVLVPLDSP